MNKNIPILLASVLMLLAVSLKATIVVITQEDLTFSPNTASVTVGDTVRWVWTSGVHTTTSAEIPAGAAAWNSPLTSDVPQFDYVVTTEGTYNYVCTPHASLGMTGSFTATATLGIADKYTGSSLKIFPNPAKEQASVMLTADKPGRGTLSVYDLLGNQINRNEVFIRQGSNNLQVPVAEIQPGIYFVELKIDNQSPIVRRFVKSR